MAKLEEVLKSREIITQFHRKVISAVEKEIPYHIKEIIFGPVYKNTPVSASLEIPIIVNDEMLQAQIDISKVDNNTGKITKINITEYGVVPRSYEILIPLTFEKPNA